MLSKNFVHFITVCSALPLSYHKYIKYYLKMESNSLLDFLFYFLVRHCIVIKNVFIKTPVLQLFLWT